MKPRNKMSKAVRVGAKYAAAFKKGIRVVVHTKTGDQVRTVTLVYDKVTVNETFPRELFVFPLYDKK